MRVSRSIVVSPEVANLMWQRVAWEMPKKWETMVTVKVHTGKGSYSSYCFPASWFPWNCNRRIYKNRP